MKVGSLVRFSGGYGADTFEVVATYGAHVALKTLTATATRAKGELFFADAADLWTWKE
jgi:hypothetical protein